MAINVEPKAYHLRHPENDTPAMAAYRGFWYCAGRAVGLKFRFPGEHFDRCLTYHEIEQYQIGLEESAPCTESTPS